MAINTVNVNFTIQDSIASAPSLQKVLLFDPSLDENSTETVTDLTQNFVSLEDLGNTFSNTNKIYKAGNSYFSQRGHQRGFKVARTTSTDANIAESLDNIFDQDSEFFVLVTTSKNEVEIDEIADWASSKRIIFIFSTEFDAIKLSATNFTDISSTLGALSYNNVVAHCHHRSGIDASTVGLVVASGVATITSTTHGLRSDDIGKEITISGHSDTTNVNGNRTILGITDADNFTVSVPNAVDATTENVDYFTRYDFIEIASVSQFIASLIGTDDYSSLKNLTGQLVIPKTILSTSQVGVLRDKNYVTYVSEYSGINVTADGKCVTGRQVKDEFVRVWLEVNTEVEAYNVVVNEKPPFSNVGAEQIISGIKKPVDEQLKRGGIESLVTLDPENYKQDYLIEVDDASTATSANRQAGIYPNFKVTVAVGGVIRSVTVNGDILV
jgi:hypothetical protein